MATVTSLPAATSNSSIKPTRAMTHPLRDPKGNGGKRKIKKGEPFDPEELSRRLTEHLTEQKLKAEQRREARALKAAALAQQNVYHHVPAVAALAFERTTTPEAMRQVHKLSKPVIKAQLERPSLEEAAPRQPFTNLQRTQAMDQANLEREMLRNRNQFQWDHDMEEAAHADIERDLYRPPQRTFTSEFAHLRGRHKKGAPRPLSTGDVCWDEDLPHIPTKSQVPLKPQNDGHDRHDWAQREEVGEIRKKERTSPFLRKMESSWILMGKKDKISPKQDIGNLGSLPDGHRKANFLALFKRHPS
ncbi:hypothetical protein ONS95_004008 [Cadophora gregata]|uniref:uncharacterized protein n=1 Tax=Cadophora gregata TaxID=51156 RepID=UPI0026DAD45D|nr:uncharacterized protein ONS95_004008 [Cadophora gregata]KAK0107312.1 hypothetical protein ONS95_004008 [Cadophora gregata]KAK0116995.1 hypothetical protein ONS96_012836 [Cadophora gregata f. sp. sojae]